MLQLQPDKTFNLIVSYKSRTEVHEIKLGAEHDLFTWAGLDDWPVYELHIYWQTDAVTALK